jgi:hypothetical protein
VVVILNEPVPEPLLLAAPDDDEPLPLEDELLPLELEEVDPLLLEAPEDDELLPLELELELFTTSLLLLPPELHAATVRHEMAASRLSSSVEWLKESVLTQAAMCRKDRYSLNIARGNMSRSRDGGFGTPVTLSAHSPAPAAGSSLVSIV